ncbi:MAG TPA: hypothetical protein VHY33_01895 [Thermoanaerobaculia bacterium]|jgi:hypothetical protein|nr:hypothetical protein [Thermoanaerobaculia bacterium]
MLNMESEFAAFLERMANGHCSREDWKAFAVFHSGVPEVEKARRTLVRAAIEADFVPSPSVPPALAALARELRASLPTPAPKEKLGKT